METGARGRLSTAPAPALLSVYVGTGVQLTVMAFVTMVFALPGS